MVKYVAKNETVFNFKFYRKGETVEAGTLLDDNINFARADGSEPAVSKDIATKAAKADDVEIRTRAKELKIANWHTKGIDKLLAEIADAEAKLATPVIGDVVSEGQISQDAQPVDETSEGV